MNTLEANMEVLQPSALMALERAQVDSQIATAHAFPRSLEMFKKRGMGMVQLDLETAESCIYYRPVGKGDDGQQKYAEGASIRMAEIVAACYGNIRVGARVIEQTERYVKCEGFAHDLETNYAAKSEAMESTVKRTGQPYDERMRIVVAKACLSKALRDAIFRVVPRALCKSIYEAAEQVISKQSKTIEQRRAAVQQWISTLKIDEARVFAVLGVKGWSEVAHDHLLTLTGIKTGLKDGEVTLDEAFPHIQKAAESMPGAPKVPESAPKTPTPPPAAQTATGTTAPAKESTNGDATKPADAAKTTEPAKETTPGPEKAAEGQKPAEATAPAEPTPEEGKQLLASIDTLMKQKTVAIEQVMAWAKANRLAKDGQKLSDLSTAKLRTINKSLGNPDMLAEFTKHPTTAATA